MYELLTSAHTSTHSLGMDIKLEVSNKIDKAMREWKPKPLITSDLARMAGITQATASRTVNGKTRPEFINLAKIARVLNLTFDGFDLGLVGGEILDANEQELITAFRQLKTKKSKLSLIGSAQDLLEQEADKVNDQSDGKGHTPAKKSRKAA